MDAKVHPARPGHRNAEETIGPVRRDLRPEKAGESADPVADHLDAAVHRSFRELFPGLGRDFRPSASAGAETVSAGFQAHPEHWVKLRPAASADQEQVDPVVEAEKVVDHPAQGHWGAAHLAAVHLAGAKALQVEVRQAGAQVVQAQSSPC
jgi:hypothetical protein